MAAGDINDPLSQIPGIALADSVTSPTDLGAGYALLKFKSGQLVWLPHSGVLTYALDTLTPGQVHGITEKATPVSADVVLLEDSEASWAKKRAPVSALPAGAPTFPSPVDWSSTLTLTQGVGITLVSKIAWYWLAGKFAYVRGHASVNSTGTAGNSIVLGGIPDAIKGPLTEYQPVGQFMLLLHVSAVYRTGAALMWSSGNELYFYVDNQQGPLGASPNVQLTAGDAVYFVASWLIP